MKDSKIWVYEAHDVPNKLRTRAACATLCGSVQLYLSGSISRDRFDRCGKPLLLNRKS